MISPESSDRETSPLGGEESGESPRQAAAQEPWRLAWGESFAQALASGRSVDEVDRDILQRYLVVVRATLQPDQPLQQQRRHPVSTLGDILTRNARMRPLQRVAQLYHEGALMATPAAVSGYFVSLDGNQWSIVRGGDMYWQTALREGVPEAKTRAQMQHKEAWFLFRWIADLDRIVKRLTRPLITRIVETGRKYHWGRMPESFREWHRERLPRLTAPPSASDLCSLWPGPFVMHQWVWHEQYFREFPEVLAATPFDRTWSSILTPYSQDFLEFMQPAYEAFLRTGRLVPYVSDATRIRRSGNIPTDLEMCMIAVRPSCIPAGADLSPTVYHTVPVEFGLASLRTRPRHVGLSLVPWGNEPRPEALRAMADRAREAGVREVTVGARAPPSSEIGRASCRERV